MLEKAVEINPGNERACDMLGRCYKEEGKLDAARALFERVIELNPRDSSAYGLLGHCYRELGQRKKSEECFRTASALRSEYYNPVTRRNYERLREIVSRRGITLVCAQYPLRNVEPLKQMFADTRGIIFVDNEAVFRDALKNGRYEDYFTDTFAGDFGHCTPRGNRLLAENLATAVLRDRP
jgi:tetratricopeptide (TPR) repeat protein